MTGLATFTDTKIVRIGDVAEQVRGVSYSKTDVRTAPEPGYIPLLRGGNVSEHGLVFDNLQFVPSDGVSQKQILRAGDIVVVASSGSLSGVGKAASAPYAFHGTFGAFCKVIRPTDKIDASYLGHYFRTAEYRSRVSRMAGGANINNLKNEHLDGLEIRLPPLPEQRRIAAILDRTDELRTKRRQALAQLDALTHSIFDSMFGDPVHNERGWDSHTVSDFLSDAIGGKNLVGSVDQVGGYRVLKISAITSLRFNPAETKPLPEDYVPPDLHLLRDGDILFSRANTSELVGATVLLRKAPMNVALPDKIWRLEQNPKLPTDSRYVEALFQHKSFRSKVSILASGSSGSMKNISKPKLFGIHIGLPPLKLQAAFGDRIEATANFVDLGVQQLAELDRLFASLQRLAFNGEL